MKIEHTDGLVQIKGIVGQDTFAFDGEVTTGETEVTFLLSPCQYLDVIRAVKEARFAALEAGYDC